MSMSEGGQAVDIDRNHNQMFAASQKSKVRSDR